MQAVGLAQCPHPCRATISTKAAAENLFCVLAQVQMQHKQPEHTLPAPGAPFSHMISLGAAKSCKGAAAHQESLSATRVQQQCANLAFKASICVQCNPQDNYEVFPC
jgi:hypothetical protein